MQETKPDTVQLQAYNLAEYSELAQKYFQQGYHFDFVSNSNFPTSFGSFFTCTMVLAKEEPVAISQEALEEPTGAQTDVVEGQVPAAPKRRSKAV